MVMDVYGRNPTAEVGEYFRNSIRLWHPLWDYCCDVYPSLVAMVPDGHYNDGDGLCEHAARRLAAKLTDELEAGRTAAHAAAYGARMDAIQDEVCSLCAGTGTRPDPPVDMSHVGGCNGCRGVGSHRPHETDYVFSADNVRDFRDFLCASGGFTIW